MVEIRIIGCWVPLQLGPMVGGGGGGEEVHIYIIYGDVPPKWVNFTQKICKHTSHFDPSPPQKKKKKSRNMGQFVENREKSWQKI